MSQLTVFKEKLREFLYAPGVLNDILVDVEKKTKVQRIYLAYGVFALIGIWLMCGWGAPLLANSIGFLYPAYWSIKALETSNLEDDKKWLTYWVVFAFFSVLEHFSGALVYLIPFYWLLKCALMCWCMMPGNNNGAEFLYTKFIRPKFHQHQNDLDKLVGGAQNMVGGFVDSVRNETKNMAADHLKAN